MHCDKCGICCKLFQFIDIPQNIKDELDDGTGVCKYLQENNECSIYLHRPDICNSEIMFEKKYKELMSREEYDCMMLEACKQLKLLKRENN